MVDRGGGLNSGEIRPKISFNEWSSVLIFAIIGFLLSGYFFLERVSGDAELADYKEMVKNSSGILFKQE